MSLMILNDSRLPLFATNHYDDSNIGNVLGDIVDAMGKVKAVDHHCELLGITTKQVIGVGDGANDLKVRPSPSSSVFSPFHDILENALPFTKVP